MNLQEIILQLIEPAEQVHFQSLLDEHHYLGSLPKIGHTLRYVVSYHGKWLALLSFSAAARKCAARDHWIGWNFRYQYDRLHLIANNSRFLILPEHHYPNLASRILSLCERRISMDWQTHFGYPLLLLETFVDPRYFLGTIYRAANWLPVGKTRGFRRTREGYSNTAQHPKLVFLRPLQSFTHNVLSQPILAPHYQYRHAINKKTGKESNELVFGVSSHTLHSANARQILAHNRLHWGVESHHYILDWNWNEDRCMISKGAMSQKILRVYAALLAA